MNAPDKSNVALPDVASTERAEAAAALSWVGMQGMVVPVETGLDPRRARISHARVDAWVNLPAGRARGIHMSRLYAQVEQVLTQDVLDVTGLHRLLEGFLDSHAELSDRARVHLAFDLLLKRDALLSTCSGWKAYPISIDARLAGARMSVELVCRVGYSSTCPASAALARQLIQQKFMQDFAARDLDHADVHDWLGSEQGVCATPHGQRSEAEVRVRLTTAIESLPMVDLIDSIEHAVQTPLQTAVKRVDEQEFARLNGANLMFCEDAARRIHAALDDDLRYQDFAVRCEHFESLHPHDAVAVAVKGVAGGYAE